MRYFIELAYNGTLYHGWQWQQNTPITLQAELEAALEKLLQIKVSLTGCGRTDAGVHAEQYFANIDLIEPITDIDFLVFRLNRVLSANMVVKRVFPVVDGASARFNAYSRTYQYRLGQQKNPFMNQLVTEWFHPINMDLMNEAAAMLMGTHDFGCFCKTRSAHKTHTCTITRADWKRDGDLYVFTVTANRFLRNMVRAIVGTHLDLSRGRMTLEDYQSVLLSGNRSLAGVSAPAQGLFLTEILYHWDRILPTTA